MQPILDGSFIEPEPPRYLSINAAYALDSVTVLIKFNESIDSTTLDPTDFTLFNSQHNALAIESISMSEESNKSILLTTALQDGEETYTLVITTLEGMNEEIIPTQGLSVEFLGYAASLTDEQWHFELFTPADITVGDPFTVTVMAFRGIDQSLIAFYEATIVWEIVGASGSLNVTESSFPIESEGIQSYELIYQSDIQGEQTESFSIKVSEQGNPQMTGNSSSILAQAPVSLHHFEIDVAKAIPQGDPFPVQISAMGSNYKTLTTYEGTITIAYQYGSGTLSCSPTQPFENGVLESICTYDTLTEDYFSIVVTDTETQISSSSQMINMGVGIGDNYSINFHALPVDTSSIRLDWNTIEGALRYSLYRKVNEGDYSLLDDLDSVTHSYLDSGLAAQSYTYKIEAFTQDMVLLGTSEVTEQPATCTNLSGPISSTTTLTETASPYCVSSNITVTGSGTDLIIEPGVEILFAAGVGITVENGAAFIAQGTGSKPIVFTSNASEPIPGDWDRIVLADTAQGTTFSSDGNYTYESGSIVQFCLFEYGVGGIKTSVSLDLEYSVFRYINGFLTSSFEGNLDGKTVMIRHTAFYDNECGRGAGMYIEGENNNIIYIEYCTFERNIAVAGGGAMCLEARGLPGEFQITGCSFWHNDASISGGAILLMNTSGAEGLLIRDNFFFENECSGNGGALYLESGDHSLQQNTFTGNTAALGGAVYAWGDVIEVQENTFKENVALDGGALYFISSSSGSTIEDNLFQKNQSNGSGASNGGGAIYVMNGVNDLIIQNNNFITNEAVMRAGAILVGDTTGFSSGHTIQTNDFKNNTAFDYGGAININGNGTAMNITVSGNTFQSNTGVDGGALFLRNTNSILVEDNMFDSNQALDDGGGSGDLDSISVLYQNNQYLDNIAANRGGGVYFSDVDNTNTLKNCYFSGNEGASGGGIASIRSAIIITGVTIEDNQALEGGGIYIDQSSAAASAIEYVVISGNTAGVGGGIFYENDLSLSLTASHIQNNVASTTSWSLQHNCSQSYPLSNIWWGSEIGDKTSFGICDSTVGTCSGSGTLTITPLATPYDLCVDNIPSTPPACVGVGEL